MENLPKEILWIILERAISLTCDYDIYRVDPVYFSLFVREFMTVCKCFCRCIKANTVCRVRSGACRNSQGLVYIIQRDYVIPQRLHLSFDASLVCIYNDIALCENCERVKGVWNAFKLANDGALFSRSDGRIVAVRILDQVGHVTNSKCCSMARVYREAKVVARLNLLLVFSLESLLKRHVYYE